MKAVTYHRVSTKDQRPELAREDLRAAAALRRLELVDEIEETGSGRRNDRPGLAKVLALASRGQISHVLCWKLDRFGRSALDVLDNIQRLTRAGVTFSTVSDGLSVGPDSGAMGKLVLTVLAAVAEFEREIISERTRLGLKAARARGRTPGRRRVTIPADVLRRALALRPRSWHAIARILAREGHRRPNGKPWPPTTLERRALEPQKGYPPRDG